MDPLYRKMRQWGGKRKGDWMKGQRDRRRVDENMYRGTNDLGQRSMKMFWTERTGRCQGCFDALDWSFPGRK